VKDGHCERCGAEDEARKLDEWFFRITAYADHLLDEMKDVEWPERVLAMQRNWIGRSEGAEILFRVAELDIDIPVFTTRPDTLFGATFFVLAPEHPLVDQLAEKSPNGDEIRDYARKAGARPAKERAAGTDKTGVFTGFFATNPVNDARIPIWIADYVLMDYGTGAIMAVPAHDERDREFGAFDLPRRVITESASSPTRRRLSPPTRGGEGDRRVVGHPRPRASSGELSAARLGLVAPALLGLPDSGRLLRRVRHRSRGGGRPAGPAARDRGLQAQGRPAAGAGRGLGPRPLPALRERGPP
jgi:leucyl-tRNA synthetase